MKRLQSNSSINTYSACQRKYYYNYIEGIPQKPNPHFEFGSLGHKILEKGLDYIPDEDLYGHLKEKFNILNWRNYFTLVYKDVQKKLRMLREKMIALNDGGLIEEHEVTLSDNEHLKGVIDVILRTNTHATIIDYKFTTSNKDDMDFDIDSQLYIYAYLVHKEYDIPLENITVAYISIPKKGMDAPNILKNGQLSRAQNQNISAEIYTLAVKAIGEDPDGPMYKDFIQSLAFIEPSYLSWREVDKEAFDGIMSDVYCSVNEITAKLETPTKEIFLARYDAYTCKNCDYLSVCKHWRQPI